MKISNEFKVGVMGVITLLILIFGYNYLKGNRFFSSSQHFYAIYDKVDGLNVSNAVKINGLTVGKVEALQLSEDTSHRIIATFTIDEDIKVPKNSKLKIVSADLLGAKMVNLELGNSSVLAVDDDTIMGITEVGLMESFSKQMEPIKNKASHAILAIDTVLQQLKVMIGDGKNNGMTNSLNDLQATIHNLKTTTDNVNGIVSDQRTRLDAILKNVESISNNFKNNNEAITHALNNIDKITDDVAKSNLKQTIADANTTIADLNSILAKIKSGQGTVGLLINDDKLYNNLKASSDDLDKLIIDLRTNPNRYVHFSLFGRNKPSK